jgi:hypothetical protein
LKKHDKQKKIGNIKGNPIFLPLLVIINTDGHRLTTIRYIGEFWSRNIAFCTKIVKQALLIKE